VEIGLDKLRSDFVVLQLCPVRLSHQEKWLGADPDSLVTLDQLDIFYREHQPLTRSPNTSVQKAENKAGQGFN
jgi:hypothetical protein